MSSHICKDQSLYSVQLLDVESGYRQLLPSSLLVQKSYMTISGFSYVGAVNQHLVCVICHEPWTEPRVLPCEHIFCTSCLEALVAEGHDARPLCPLDRKPVPSNIRDLPQPSNVIRLMLDELMVKCDSCNAEMQRQVSQR